MSSDELDDSDWAGMVIAVVPLGRWTLFGDAARLERSATGPMGDFGNQKYIDLEQQIYGLSVGYRVTEGGTLDVDVLAGARYTFVDANLNITGGYIGAPPFGIVVPGTTANDGEGWVDPIVGAHLVCHLAEHFAVVGHFDAGGGMSHLTVQGIASVDVDLWRTFTASVGYRHLYTDYDDADFTWKMNTAGFFVGLGVRF